jgi:putative tricarboxylic transport membrane protein
MTGSELKMAQSTRDESSKMDRKEGLLSFIALVLGLVVAIASWTHNVGTLARPGPFLLPLLTALCLAATGLNSLVRTFSAKQHNKEKPDELFDRSPFKVVAIVMAIGVYTAILSWIGYLVSTFLLLVFLFKAAGFQKWTNVVLASFLVTAFSYLLFGYALKLRFPPGIFPLV